MKLIKYYLPGVITGVILSLVVSRIKSKQCDENSINDDEELLFYNDEEDIVHYDHVRELIMEISPLVPFALDNEQHADFIESLWTHYGQKMMIALVDYVEYCERINGDFEFDDVKNNDKCMAIRHCIIDKMNFYTLTNIAFSDDDENIKNIMSPVRDYFISIPGFNRYAPYESTIDCMQVHAEIERNVINHIDFED